MAGTDAKAAILAPLDQACTRLAGLPRVYFFLLKHDLVDPEPSPVPGIYWRPLVGPHAIDARMIRAAPRIAGHTHNSIAEMSYQICRACRLGIVWRISTDEDWRLRGIATAMIERGRRHAAGYVWCTSEQLPDAVSFWRKIGERTGLGYQPGDECQHMRRVGFVNARDRIHDYAGGRG